MKTNAVTPTISNTLTPAGGIMNLETELSMFSTLQRLHGLGGGCSPATTTWQTLTTGFPLGTMCLYLKVPMAKRARPRKAAAVEIPKAAAHFPSSSMYEEMGGYGELHQSLPISI
ncbi:unnamed protein product [Alopecurus aequalis]